MYGWRPYWVLLMKQTNKVTLSALMAALSVVLMLGAYIPYLTYTFPAFAGLFIMVVLLEIGKKWALLSYITSAALTVLLCEPEAMLMYVFLFGYYPILKAVIERINKPIFEWPIKLIVFNSMVILVYFFVAKLFNLNLLEDVSYGKYFEYGVLAIANVVFVFYDITVSRIANLYFIAIRPKIKRLLK